MDDRKKLMFNIDYSEIEWRIVAYMVQKYGEKEDFSQQEMFTEEYERESEKFERDLDF